jgi:STE24 endopeptidase
MQLLLVLAIIATVSISECAEHQPVADASARLIVAIATMAVAPLFAAAFSTFIVGSLRRDSTRRTHYLQKFSRLRGLHSLIWLAGAAIVLQHLGWVRLVRFNWHMDGVFLLDDVLVFLPVIVPLVLSWAAFYEVERYLYGTAQSQDLAECSLVTRRQYLVLHARQYLAVLFIPAIAVLTMQDVIRYAEPIIPGDSEALLLFLPIGALIVFFPLLLKRIWDTEPLASGELRDRLLAFSDRLGFKSGELLVWRTNRMIANAAIAGLVRPWRYVFFSDVLLAKFDLPEIEVILGHEIGHVSRKHLLERLLLMALPILLWFVFARSFPDLIQSISLWLADIGIREGIQAAAFGPIALALYAATLFASHAKLLEYDADLYAARAVDPDGHLSPIGTQSVTAVLEKLAIVAGMNRRKRSWLHPTIARRIAFLRDVAERPAIGEAFERRRRSSRRLLVVLVTTAIAYLAVTAT